MLYFAIRYFTALTLSIAAAVCLRGTPSVAEPPPINPFAPKPAVRSDSVPGCIELSDGTTLYGQIHLTRDKRLKIKDERIGRQREIPLPVVARIDCIVKKEWLEKEWRFKELALDEKIYTGKKYPVREYLHEITLQDGRKITGPLSALVYIQPPEADNQKNADKKKPKPKAERFILHKRDKGKPGTMLKELVYVKSIELGEKAMKEARQKVSKKKRK